MGPLRGTCLKTCAFEQLLHFIYFSILVYFDVDSVIPDIGVAATLEFNFGPFQGSIDAIN